MKSWREGKGAFPYTCLEELTWDEADRGIRELKEDDSGDHEELYNNIGCVEWFISRRGTSDHVSVLRERFNHFRDVSAKLYIGLSLVWLGDWTPIPLAEETFRDSTDSSTRIAALNVLSYALSISELRDIQSREDERVVRDIVEGRIKSRERDESDFFQEHGRRIGELSMDELRAHITERRSVLLMSELCRRSTK